MTDTISIRLTQTQASQIWPGLDYLVWADKARREKRSGYREYPFRLYPPAANFDRGKYHASMMDEIIRLRNELQPRSNAGGRMHMNAIQIRAAIFAVRTNLANIHRLRHELRNRKSEDKARRKWKAEEKARLKVDDTSFAPARRRAPRVIASLERRMKRANRLLRSMTTREEYDTLMSTWKQHVRWMQLHVAYFKPWPTVVRGKKTRQQRDLDELVKLAKLGLSDARLQSRDDVELRRLMRLYGRSARRGHQGKWTIPFILANKGNPTARWVLAQCVKQRRQPGHLS